MNTEPFAVDRRGRRHNGERSPDEIEADIDDTRARMDADLAALESRLSPGHLLDEAIRQLRSGGAAEYFRNLGNTAKLNPVPLALVGTGLAWLALSSRAPGAADTSAEYGYGYEGAWQGATATDSAAESAADDRQAGASWERAADGASAAIRTARDKAQEIGAQARDGMHSARAQARQGARRVADFMDEQPLIAAGVALTVGALLGAVLPSTRRENELMGQRSDELKGTLKRETEAAVQKVEEGIKTTVRSAQQAARSPSSSAQSQPSPAASLRGTNDPQSAYSPPPGEAAAVAGPGSLLPEEDLAIGEERGARVTPTAELSTGARSDGGDGRTGGATAPHTAAKPKP